MLKRPFFRRHEPGMPETTSPPVHPSGQGQGPRRVLFYSHDGYGLGHLRRTLAIARIVAKGRPDVALLALTGSLHTDAYEALPNLDYVKLPAAAKRHLYEGLPAFAPEHGALRNIWYVRETLIHETTSAFAPHLVVVDQAPAGLGREMVRALTSLGAARPRPALVLVLRDITYGPEETRAIWQREGVYDLLDHAYDHILVCGSRDVFDPVQEYGFSPAAAAKTVFCGYIRRPEPVLPVEHIRECLGAVTAPLVVVTAGGGGDGGALMRSYVAALRGAMPNDLVSVIVTGPFLKATERAELEAAAAGLPGVTVIPFSSDLVSYLHAADAVVTMGGYNTVCEAVSLGKRPIVVPRVVGSQEQLIRAERFAQRGLVTLLHPDDLTPERLWQAVQDELNRSTSPAPILDFDGLQRLGSIMIDALEA